jgi:hypothetical protein
MSSEQLTFLAVFGILTTMAAVLAVALWSVPAAFRNSFGEIAGSFWAWNSRVTAALLHLLRPRMVPTLKVGAALGAVPAIFALFGVASRELIWPTHPVTQVTAKDGTFAEVLILAFQGLVVLLSLLYVLMVIYFLLVALAWTIYLSCLALYRGVTAIRYIWKHRQAARSATTTS